MPPRALSDDDIAWAVDQLRGRRRVADVAADLGVATATLLGALHRRGLTARSLHAQGREPAPPVARPTRFFQLRIPEDDHRDLVAYAERHGVPATTVVLAALRHAGVVGSGEREPADLGFRPRRETTRGWRAAERRRRLVELVDELGRPDGQAGVRAFAARLGTTERTVYRDLAILEAEHRRD